MLNTVGETIENEAKDMIKKAKEKTGVQVSCLFTLHQEQLVKQRKKIALIH